MIGFRNQADEFLGAGVVGLREERDDNSPSCSATCCSKTIYTFFFGCKGSQIF